MVLSDGDSVEDWRVVENSGSDTALAVLFTSLRPAAPFGMRLNIDESSMIGQPVCDDGGHSESDNTASPVGSSETGDQDADGPWIQCVEEAPTAAVAAFVSDPRQADSHQADGGGLQRRGGSGLFLPGLDEGPSAGKGVITPLPITPDSVHKAVGNVRAFAGTTPAVLCFAAPLPPQRLQPTGDLLTLSEHRERIIVYREFRIIHAGHRSGGQKPVRADELRRLRPQRLQVLLLQGQLRLRPLLQPRKLRRSRLRPVQACRRPAPRGEHQIPKPCGILTGLPRVGGSFPVLIRFLGARTQEISCGLYLMAIPSLVLSGAV